MLSLKVIKYPKLVLLLALPILNYSMLLDTFATHWPLILLFFGIAALYASVGFGGGSSYLAVLTLFGIAFSQIRATALLCNIIVVSGNVYLYYRKDLYVWKKVLPLVLFSIPLAFMGGYLRISEVFFFVILGLTLVGAAGSMWLSNRIQTPSSSKNLSLRKNATYGGFIGFISGMVGIGGGIFLAPLLHLTQWDTPKKIAATASFFILVNSIAGLIGQAINPTFAIEWKLTLFLLVSVGLGGQVGARFSHRLFSPIILRKATAVLVAFVGYRILWNLIFSI